MNIRHDSQKIKSKSNVEYAVDYARLGWSVVPVVRGTKTPPKGETWVNRRFLSASECADEEWKKKHPDAVWGRATETEIRAWWKKYPTASIGILTGRISGIDVVDFDGPGARERLEAEAGVQVPDSISQTTGRADGGRHILLAYHGGGLVNKAGYVEGVDVRTDGGLFVVAPSVHKTGRQYTWDIDPTEMGLDDLEEFPPELLSFLLSKCDKNNGTGQCEDRINPDKLFKEGIPDGQKHHDLFRFACQKIQQGISKEEALVLTTELARRCDPLPKDGPEKAAKDRVDQAWAKYGSQQNNGNTEDEQTIRELENRIWQKWPSLGAQALTGLASRFVEIASRKSEADPAAILLTFLARFAVECGSDPFFYVGDAKHYARIFSVIVGASSKSRKGTSSKPVKRLFRMGLLASDDIFIPARVSPGPLSSGEGLIYAVRDEVTAWKVDKKTGEGEEVVIDPGVDDKRLFVLDEEFSSALIASKREGNTLSTILRSIWDTGDLEPLTKNNRIRATGAHIGIVSHITLAELNRKLDEVEAFSGFANRILWVCARRQGVVPFPEPMPEKELASLQWELKAVIEKVRKFSEMKFSEDAREMWQDIYSDLSKDHSGLVGAVIDRAEAQVIRLAMIYSLLDKSDIVEAGHLDSALAVWRYCEASAGFIFAGREVNPYSQKILDLLREGGEKTVTDIYEHFNRHIKKNQLEQAIMEMVSQKKIELEKIQTKGRPKTVFRCCFNQRPCEESEESEESLDFSF